MLALQEKKVEVENIQRAIAFIYHQVLDSVSLDRSSDGEELICAVQKAKVKMKKYQAAQANMFLENFENEAQLIGEVERIQEEIYEINKPAMHSFELRKLE